MAEYSASELVELADRRGYIVIPVNSSYVEQIAYDLLERNLVVTINANEYVYYNIPFHQFYKFVNAESKGWFYNTYVKGRW